MPHRIALLLLLGVMCSCAGTPRHRVEGAPSGVVAPEFVEAMTIDNPRVVGPDVWAFGGISGIELVATDPADRAQSGRFLEVLVASDDRAEFAPARLGTLKVPLEHGRFSRRTPEVRWRALTDEHGVRFSKNRVDPEGVRAHPGAGVVYWSSEGRTKEGEPPAVFELASDGSVARLELPREFIPDTRAAGEQTRGVRNNRGFEALAYTAHGPEGTTGQRAHTLFAGVEEPLAQDESPEHRVCRVLVYEGRGGDTRSGIAPSMRPVRVLLYPLGPAPGDWERHQNGLTELVCIDEHRLLALERAERVIEGVPFYNVRLYLVSTRGAADVIGHAGLARVPGGRVPPTMTKRLVLDFDDIAGLLPGERPMNFEGLALGVDGSVLVISDNDHGVEGPTVLVRLHIPPSVLGAPRDPVRHAARGER